ncbi:hypothetical protein HanRHA438_Chr09g0405411 [Helianthus annuus]|nr:hypothetical protein HanRHA438_Chr09g0405411 [Helianthus annuus]
MLYISAYLLKCFCFDPNHPNTTTVTTDRLSSETNPNPPPFPPSRPNFHSNELSL